ncbi:MAG: 6-hydroxymethylpterin diphosphokinase MptE-like protein, partial [Nitrososphaerales archaeon]
ADALNEAGITPSIIVSDLDSCSQENLEIGSQEGLVLVHAHGDNMNLIEKIVPKLGSKLYGTTQVSSVSRVTNFGGLTDGDRACFVMSYLAPSSIIIAGMDFGGTEGKHSKNRYVVGTSPLRPSKLQWGKRSLEFLIQSRPEIRFANATKHGEEIVGAPKVSYEKITLGAF